MEDTHSLDTISQGERLEELIEFAENPEPRCPCILLIDTSGSMEGEKIGAVNSGIREFRASVLEDPLASSRAEIAIVGFNHTSRVHQDFATPINMSTPTLSAGGSTNISGAIKEAMELLENRKRTYRTNGIEHYRPMVILVTDGEPTSDDPNLLRTISQEITQQEEQRKLTFFTFGVDGANLKKLATIAPPNRPPQPLREAKIEELFLWLSNSMSAISQSQPGDRIRLPHPDFLDFG